MCGRYSLYVDDYEKFYNDFEITNRLDKLTPHYNITPGMHIPVIVKNSPKKIELMRWGLIPFWSKDPKIGYKMINARSEGIEAKPAFRKPLRSQRCLIPTSGFYEWKHIDNDKIPFYIKLKGQNIFAFAGLFDIWKDAESRPLKSFTIITTSPNNFIASIHDRMPVILKENYEDKWLNPETDLKEILSMLKPYEDSNLEAYPVSKLVNNPANDTAEIIRPV